MCLRDNRLQVEVTANSFVAVSQTTARQFLGPSPYRVGLVFSSGMELNLGTQVTVGNDGRITVTGGLQIGGIMVKLLWSEVGPLVQQPWFVIDALGGTSIWVAEMLLPAEFWPILLGQVSIDTLPRR